MDFRVNPTRVSLFFVAIVIVLTCLHVSQLVAYFIIDDPDRFDFIQALDFDYEGNLPSMYSSFTILLSAFLLCLIGTYQRRTEGSYVKHWYGLSLIFFFLSLDEGVAIHEEVGDFFESLELFDASGMLYFAWVVPYAVLLILFLASYLRFTFKLPASTRRLFIISGLLFVSGAVGLETLSASEADEFGTNTITYSVLYTIEELLEMLAIILFNYALMRFIEAGPGSLNIQFGRPSP